MRIGTKSVLFGVHQFLLHPLLIAIGWWKAYGFGLVEIGRVEEEMFVMGLGGHRTMRPRFTSLLDPRLWLVFFVHDLGYLGKPNMDGAEGETHPEFGAGLLRWLCGDVWGDFVLLHSRYYAKRLGRDISPLCLADKWVFLIEPAWLYLPRARASGELAEFIAMGQTRAMKQDEPFDDEERAALLSGEPRRWHAAVRKYMQRWIEEHADGKADSWSAVRHTTNGDDNGHRGDAVLPGRGGDRSVLDEAVAAAGRTPRLLAEPVRSGQKAPVAGVKVNGVALGPDSPLLAGGRRTPTTAQATTPKTPTLATFTMSEFTVQAGLIELLVGEITKGERQPGAGLTGRIPSLALIHALPNGAAARGKAAAGKRKAEGQLAGMPDLCWPVARGPYLTLYLETKREKGRAKAHQRVIHDLLRAEGHAVVVYDTTQKGLDLVLAYHALRATTRAEERDSLARFLALAPDAGSGVVW